MMAPTPAAVQCYFLGPNADVPNSPLPVLHYRDVLPEPRTEASATDFLTRNRWEKRGVWGHIGIRHFHPNSHECYGIFQGRSKLLLGKIESGAGREVEVCAGDVVVLPAGTAHSSLASSPDYRYVGVYPRGCPRWTNETGETPPRQLGSVIREVGMPEDDPVYGTDGPLVRLWQRDVLAKL